MTEKLIELYNKAIHQDSARGKFFEKFLPFRIGVFNTVERRSKSLEDIAPIFKKANDGDFFCCVLTDNSSTHYFIIPRFGLVYQESYHE